RRGRRRLLQDTARARARRVRRARFPARPGAAEIRGQLRGAPRRHRRDPGGGTELLAAAVRRRPSGPRPPRPGRQPRARAGDRGRGSVDRGRDRARGENAAGDPRARRRAREERAALAEAAAGGARGGALSMGIKCGIVGLPNVGKSTLFNALTASEIPAENYPFCTIDPNVGVVTVPDPRLDAIAAIVKPERVVPTVVEFVDIAGL